ncbi:HD domain-containing protein [Butyrivibrio fibrisolvens]|uniref:HD domain-containing protein n=1 Tax=Butyrivibrio fibrisolvens TaxID=831 RepID=UPI0003B407C4|nr:HD domain-containing protein [Butyrivibrio fibrisolvens]
MTKVEREIHFKLLVDEIAKDARSQQMKNYIQHGRITTFDHCMRVARLSYALDRAFRLRSSERELIRGAFLHDYFLYDWHKDFVIKKAPENWILPFRLMHKFFHLHGFTHPQSAMENALRDFDLTDKEAQIIRSHMWPLTFLHPPKSREAILVCAADKIVSLQETVAMR